MEIYHVFVSWFSKSSAADLLYVGKGWKLNESSSFTWCTIDVNENTVTKAEIAHSQLTIIILLSIVSFHCFA